MRNTTQVLFDLCSAYGASGAENAAAMIASHYLSEFARVRTDGMGNVIGEIAPPDYTRHVLLEAHIDEIGLIVTAIEDGFLRVAQCGGVDRRILPGADVVVLGKQALSGVFCSTPPHLSRENTLPELSDMAVDIARTQDETCALVSAGDRVLLKSEPCHLLGTRISSKALDNRAGVTAVLRALDLLGHNQNTRLTILFSSREETGHTGAITGCFGLNPDEALVVDVSFGMAPGLPKQKCGELSKGTMIGISPILSRGISNRLQEVAAQKNIPHQTEVMGGQTGTNADTIAISGGGIATGLLSIPLRYMHTGVEIIDMKDIESTAQLLAYYITEGGFSDD